MDRVLCAQFDVLFRIPVPCANLPRASPPPGHARAPRQPPIVSASSFAASAEPADATPQVWPHWQRVAFRFLAIYFTLQIAPWWWLGFIPGVDWVLAPYERALDWAVRAGNSHLFHVRDPVVLPNGSGDTSWAWAQIWLFLAIAAVGALA